MVIRRVIKISRGTVSFIYADKMKPFLDLGEAKITRASHVEPETIDGKIKWVADMSPSGGPKLDPCDTRQEALDAEVEWLNENRLGANCEEVPQ